MEVEALLCEIGKFLKKELQEAFLDESLESEVMLVEWAYSYGGGQPVGIAFVLEAFSEDGTVTTEAMFESLKLDEPALEDLIKNYIWKVKPDDSVFHQTSSASFTAKTGVPVPTWNHLVQICCPAGECLVWFHCTFQPPTQELNFY
jgi:hypothetical protein